MAGSNAPRPKKNRETLHNEKWLRRHYIDQDMTASDIARLLGCAVPSVIWALNKFGIKVKGISAAKKGKPVPKRRVPDSVACKTTLMNRAHERMEGTPKRCCVCGSPKRVEPNHKDRDIRNTAKSNLEWLCASCHRRQHRLEEGLALCILVEQGYPILDLYRQARHLALEK
jgi:transposase-like protein